MGVKKIITTIKKDRWSLQDKQYRYEFLNWFCSSVPGHIGMELRAWLYAKYIPRMGKNCQFLRGVKIRNIERLTLGNNVLIGEDCFLQAGGEIEIGDNTLLGPGAKIWSVNHVFADADQTILEQGTVGEKVVIGKDCWIAANAFIMPGTILGDGCVVGACAVVGRKQYPPYSILVGNPAKRIGFRKKASG